MSKVLHLVCNAHLDPVWQWDWDEGSSACLATFYSAVKLAKEYDYIFCHNEVILYEYVEKYDPDLFAEIQKLVKEGKWHIMGGWYDQPDCAVPSGESFIRQITLGREYFMEKFASRPTVALNFDAFAHTRGLPQILRKTGFDSYIVCRPMPWHDFGKKKVPSSVFNWVGYDGSKVKCLRVDDLNIYCSHLGDAKEAILRKNSAFNEDDEQRLILWGVGNHGGGASRKDLSDIMELMDEKKGEYKIIHSTPEAYFNSVESNINFDQELYTFRKSLSSVSLIKQKHDELENALYTYERVCSASALLGVYEYNKSAFKYAEKILAQSEFHDVLSGTAIKTGYDSTIKMIDSAINGIKEEFYKAVFARAKEFKSTKPGDESFIVLNPLPFEVNEYVEMEYLDLDPADYCVNHYEYDFYDENGRSIEYQIIKEESLLNMNRRVRFLLNVTIPALGLIKVNASRRIEGPKNPYIDDGHEIVIKDSIKTIKIDRKTGLISSFMVNDKEYANKGLCQPVMFDDNEDPWGWHTADVGKNYKDIPLDSKGKGPFEGLKQGVTIVEEGNLLTEVQALFSRGESHIVTNYKIYKDVPYVDVQMYVLWNERNKGLRLKFPLNGKSRFFCQAAYGIEFHSNDGHEYLTNRYSGVEMSDSVFAIYNKSGIHSNSKKGKNLYLLLLNGSAYCCHPCGEYPLIREPARFVPSIEQGVHNFSFRLSVNNINECEKNSQIFNQSYYALEYFPHEESSGKVINEIIKVSNSNVVVSAFKQKKYGGYLFRLYNGSSRPASTEINILGKKKKVSLKKFEFKTFEFDGKTITEAFDASIY